MNNFDINTVNKFSAKIRYKLETYLDSFRLFTENNLPSITSYFSDADNNTFDTDSFDILQMLKKESIKIDNLIKNNKQKFTTIDEWELFDYLENIKIKLDTYLHVDKWLRSSKDFNSYKSVGLKSNRILEQDETLEEVEISINGEENSQNDWVNISIQNQLLEKDYNEDGGNLLVVSKQQNSSPNYFLNSVVDNLVKEKMYGKDFHRKIQFVDNDLLCINNENVIKQTVDILLSLEKGDIPEFPNFGRQRFTGNDVAALLFTAPVRQLNDIFSSDDTLRNFNVKNIGFVNGDVFIICSVDTFYNFIYNTSVKINTNGN